MKAAHLPGARSRAGGPLTGDGKLLLDSGARLNQHYQANKLQQNHKQTHTCNKTTARFQICSRQQRIKTFTN